MMDRRAFIATLTGSLLAAPFAAEAQQAPRHGGIGVFFSGSPHTAFERTWGQSFVSALRDLGWVEGQNLAIHWRYSEDQEDRRREIVAEFARLKVDVIVVQSTPETAVTKLMNQDHSGGDGVGWGPGRLRSRREPCSAWREHHRHVSDGN